MKTMFIVMYLSSVDPIWCEVTCVPFGTYEGAYDWIDNHHLLNTQYKIEKRYIEVKDV